MAFAPFGYKFRELGRISGWAAMRVAPQCGGSRRTRFRLGVCSAHLPSKPSGLLMHLRLQEDGTTGVPVPRVQAGCLQRG